MKRLFIAAIVAFGLSSAALAQTQPIPTAIAPGGQTMNSTPTAIMVAPAGGAGGKGTVVAPDHPLPVTMGAAPLPAGGATAAKQDTGNASLGSIDTKLTSQATAAAQATGNASLATIVTNTTGVSTAANQTAPQANAGSDATKATAVQGITGGKPISTTSTPTASTVDRSITVIVGGAAQLVMALNTSRKSFYVFNPNSNGVCWGSFTTATPAANGLGAFPLPSLGGFGMETNAATSALYVNCPTTGQFVTAWESN